ncbi:MAG: LCP family protein [Anaerolineales bacterium]|nr:LCP family protein [Anaerolineales bacterium]
MTKKSLNITNWAISLLAVAFGITLLIAGFVSFSVVRDLTASYTGVGLNPFQNSSGDEVDGPAAPDVTPTAVRLEATPQPWDGKSRVTVLVMGLDYRDWVSSKDAPRSDTMMLITIDPITLQAGMLSIPRDLWVEIPGFTYNRINTAFMFGEAYNLPGGGPALAQKTVENLLGVPITYYAVIDFHAFERIIDEIGGIEVLVEQRVKISPIGGISKWLEAKPYHLDGADALAYARVRKNAGGDFGRAQRQQQVILAVMDKVVGFDILPGLVARSPALYQELATGIRTNLSLEQIVSLAWLALKVPKENIQSGSIGPPNMVGFYTRPDGAQVLRFVPDQIRILRDKIFVETSALNPTIPELPDGGYTP